MNNELSITKIRRSIRRFGDYAGDVLKADHNTFDDRLDLLFSFCESDPIFSEIHRQLVEMPSVDFDKWTDERGATVTNWAGAGKLQFPTDPEQRMALMYQLLLSFREGKLDWSKFGLLFFAISSSRYDDYIYAINEAISEPLFRELGYRLEEIGEELPSDQSILISPSIIQIVHNAENVIQQNAAGSNITQTATQIDSTEITAKFQELRKLVDEQSKDKETDLELVDAAEKEAQSKNGKVSVVKAILGGLSIAGAAASIISAIAQAMG